MANTVTRAAPGATGGAPQVGRELAQRVARGAARKAMSGAGSVVLGAVVDMVVSRVDRVADRLDGVAESGGTGLWEAVTGRPAPARSDSKPADEAGTAVPARVGAAFSLVVASAVKLLQFVQRLALQLLEVLRRLARRTRAAPPEPAAAGADEEGPAQDVADEDSEPSERRKSRAERHGPRTAPRSDAPDPKPGRSVPARPTVQRRRPAPPPTQARRR